MQLKQQAYWRCEHCQATLLDPACYLSPEQERAYYALHENHPDDPGYRRFLSRLSSPLQAVLPPGCHGLDYGCGPGSALAAMLQEAGYRITLYDPFFHPDPQALARAYDFITCSEVVEHFHHPAEQFRYLDSLLKPGGVLAIMTCFQTDDERFANWHYRRDPTHVVFYREATFHHLARQFAWHCEVPCKDVVLMTKRHSSPPDRLGL